jgi:hypothetical protein
MKQQTNGKFLAGLILIGLSVLVSFWTLVSLPSIVSSIRDLFFFGGTPLFAVAYGANLISDQVAFFGAIAVIVSVLVAKNKKSLRLFVLVVGIAGPGLALITDFLWLFQGGSFAQAFFGLGLYFPIQLRVLATFPAIAGFILLFLGLSSMTAAPASQPAQENRFDPMTGQPIVAPVAAPAGAGAQSNLPMIALILAFFVPLAAVIVGHISLNQMKQGLISSANQSMAKTGVILGYVFIGLGFLFGIIFAVVYASILNY